MPQLRRDLQGDEVAEHNQKYWIGLMVGRGGEENVEGRKFKPTEILLVLSPLELIATD